jgi:hypothetical protein
MTCEKDNERQARNREYQRKYRARLRAKADGNQKEQSDPHAAEKQGFRQQGLIINNATTLLLYVINVEHIGLQVMTQKKHIMSTWRISNQQNKRGNIKQNIMVCSLMIKRQKDKLEIKNISVTIVQSLAILKNWHQMVCLFPPSS